MSDPIAALEVVSKGLGDLLPRVVFVGGATCSLYIDSAIAEAVRPTDDVDCIVEFTSHLAFREFEDQLSHRGFKRATGSTIIYRWTFRGITVDVMPTDEKILGFSNRWYELGLKDKQTVTLPSGTEIFIFSLPAFLASKFEALLSRGADQGWRR